jgi:hypothetical protein
MKTFLDTGWSLSAAGGPVRFLILSKVGQDDKW